MIRLVHVLLLLHFSSLSIGQPPAKGNRIPAKNAYFPPYGEWKVTSPGVLKISDQYIDSAVVTAIRNEVKNTRDLSIDQANTFGKAPFGEAIGPMAARGEPTGLIIYKGYIIASWGEPERVDMVHSVTKSFLSTLVGKAIDSGLIRSVMDTVAAIDPVFELYDPGAPGKAVLYRPFDTPHNRTITWNDLLRQTSDWEGTLWGKPEWADRPDSSQADWKTRKRFPSGSRYEYNDVRVNALALTLTGVWRRPLPQVLKQFILDPIGASDRWRWSGYNNSWITLDGMPVQSVSGGGHWGGGIFMDAYDMGRFGLLAVRRGKWNGRQLISEDWITQALTPTSARTDYGYMNWYLNTDKKLLPAAPINAFMHIGNGNNLVYGDPSHDLVIVARWITSKGMNAVIEQVMKAGGWDEPATK
ncbi:MAG: class C beta-lactamase-related serine hydrolase [Chitinophagaceae bacterium]|nr:MAG: class C beta-lactamase-related serine hydrolase [Chitinophagaceae bacterium]